MIAAAMIVDEVSPKGEDGGFGSSMIFKLSGYYDIAPRMYGDTALMMFSDTAPTMFGNTAP